MVKKRRKSKEGGNREYKIKDKIGRTCNVRNCRLSESVVIAKIETEEKKKELTKNKLRGERIFIENNLNWEEKGARTNKHVS